jgi:hypothetical protein
MAQAVEHLPSKHETPEFKPKPKEITILTIILGFYFLIFLGTTRTQDHIDTLPLEPHPQACFA